MNPSMNLSSRTHGAMVLLLSLLVALPAGAAPGHGGMKHFDREFPLERMTQALDLTSEQQQAIAEITARTREDARPYREKLELGHEQMKTVMQADTFDEQQVRALISKNHEAMTELMVLHKKQQFEIRALLTAAQREKFRDVMHHGRHEHSGPRADREH